MIENDSNTVPTEEMSLSGIHEAVAARKSPSVNVPSMLADALAWMRDDVSELDQTLMAHSIETAAGFAEIRVQARHIWYALVAIATLLLVNAVLTGFELYVLGMVIGHVR